MNIYSKFFFGSIAVYLIIAIVSITLKIASLILVQMLWIGALIAFLAYAKWFRK